MKLELVYDFTDATIAFILGFLYDAFLEAFTYEDEETNLSIICSNTILVNGKKQTVYFGFNYTIHRSVWNEEIKYIFEILSQSYGENLTKMLNSSQKRKNCDNDDIELSAKRLC